MPSSLEKKDASSTLHAAAISGPARKSLAIVYGLLGILAAINLLGLSAFIRPALAGGADFRIFYTAGSIVKAGELHLLYDAGVQKSIQDARVSPSPSPLLFNHAAYEALLFTPFAFLSYRAAYLAFFLMNCVMLAVIYLLLRREFGNVNLNWRWMPLALVGAFLPLYISLMQGQDSILLLLLFVACALQLRRGNEWLAGFVLALGLFKFQFVIPIALVAGIRKWRVLGGFAVGACALGGISLWMVGYQGTHEFVQMLLDMSAHLSGTLQQSAFMVHPEMMGNLRGLVETTASTFLSHNVLQLLTGGLSIGLLVWCAVRTKSFANMVLAAVIVSYHALPHDLSLLMIPIATLAVFLAKGQSEKPALDLTLLVALVGMPTVLLFCGARFYLFAILLLAVLALRSKIFEGEATHVAGAT